jgi:hypothetical protein
VLEIDTSLQSKDALPVKTILLFVQEEQWE